MTKLFDPLSLAALVKAYGEAFSPDGKLLIPAEDLETCGITATKIEVGSIPAGTITTTKLAAGAVTSSKMAPPARGGLTPGLFKDFWKPGDDEKPLFGDFAPMNPSAVIDRHVRDLEKAIASPGVNWRRSSIVHLEDRLGASFSAHRGVENHEALQRLIYAAGRLMPKEGFSRAPGRKQKHGDDGFLKERVADWNAFDHVALKLATAEELTFRDGWGRLRIAAVAAKLITPDKGVLDDAADAMAYGLAELDRGLKPRSERSPEKQLEEELNYELNKADERFGSW